MSIYFISKFAGPPAIRRSRNRSHDSVRSTVIGPSVQSLYHAAFVSANIVLNHKQFKVLLPYVHLKTQGTSLTSV